MLMGLSEKNSISAVPLQDGRSGSLVMGDMSRMPGKGKGKGRRGGKKEKGRNLMLPWLKSQSVDNALKIQARRLLCLENIPTYFEGFLAESSVLIKSFLNIRLHI